MNAGGPQGPVKPTERPYIRYVPPDHDELDGRVEYDLEDEDLAWTAATQKAISRSNRAAFTEELVERLIDRFEKELHCAVLQQPDLWQDDEASLQLDAATLYPLARARQVREPAAASVATKSGAVETENDFAAYVSSSFVRILSLHWE